MDSGESTDEDDDDERTKPPKRTSTKATPTTTASPIPIGLQGYLDRLIDQLKDKHIDALLYWNLISIEACANDYDPDVVLVSDQPGSTSTSRALAIIHLAMYESTAVFHTDLLSTLTLTDLPALRRDLHEDLARDFAIMESAYRTLYALFPKQRPIFDGMKQHFFTRARSSKKEKESIEKGLQVGQIIARVILTQRSSDGSTASASYVPIDRPGFHRVDPLHPLQGFASVQWGNVTPFLLPSVKPFHPPNTLGLTPDVRLDYLNSKEYQAEFERVKSVGAKVSSTRTADEEEMGIFWAYDGAPKVGTTPRLFNQLLRQICIEKRNKLIDNVKLFAMLNMAMADAAIVTWNVKYLYNTWRPIVAIRQAVGRTEPLRSVDWEPLGAPADGKGTDFSPNFPAYPSGHTAFGSICFELLRLFYGRDSIAFRFQSDEYNGKTIDSRTGRARPRRARSFTALSQAEDEIFRGRVFLGVQWPIDQVGGQFIGSNIAKYVFNLFAGSRPRIAMSNLQLSSAVTSIGFVNFIQFNEQSSVHVFGTLMGLSNNTVHGFHAHRDQLLDGERNCSAAGPHFNPLNTTHGPRTADINHRHVGDFGNLTANNYHIIIVDFEDSIITLYDSIRLIYNRTLVLHAMRDDGGTGGFNDSLTVGNAGGRLACANIDAIATKYPQRSTSANSG